MLLNNFILYTRPKVEQHMLVVMNESVHEEHLSQSLQTSIKQFKIVVNLLIGYNGISNVQTKTINSVSQYHILMLISIK